MHELTNSFLRLVQPRTVDELIETIGIDMIKSENFTVLVQYLSGYICFILALLILLLIVTVICCCILCGRSSDRQMELSPKPYGRLQVWCFSIFLIALSLTALILCSYGLHQNSAVGRETGHNYGLKHTLDVGLGGLEDYTQRTIVKPYANLLNLFQHFQFYSLSSFNHLKNLLKENNTNIIRNVKEVLSNTNQTLYEISGNLEYVEDIAAAVNPWMLVLDKKLTEIKRKIMAAMANCGHAACIGVYRNVRQHLTVGPLIGISKEMRETSNVTNHSKAFMNEKYMDALNVLQNLSEMIISNFSKDILDLQDEIRSVANTFKIYNDALGKLSLRNLSKMLGSCSSIVNHYGCIMNQISLGLTIADVISMVFFVFGVILGLSELVKKDSEPLPPCRSRSLLTYVVFSITLLTVLSMIASSTMFLMGGVIKNEICRYLSYEPEVRDVIPRLDILLSPTIKRLLHLPFPISVLNFTLACQKNQHFHVALGSWKKETEFNETLHSKTQDFENMALAFWKNDSDQIEKKELNYETMNSTFSQMISTLGQTAMDRIAEKLNQTTLTMDLFELAKGMEGLIIRNWENGTFVNERIKGILDLHVTNVSQINDLKTNGSQTVTLINSDINRLLKMELLRGLVDGQSQLFAVRRRFIKRVRDIIDEILRNLNIASEGCKPMYDAGVDIVEAHCKQFLNPFNTVWLASCIVHVIVLVILLVVKKAMYLYQFIEKDRTQGRGTQNPLGPLERSRPNRISPDEGDVCNAHSMERMGMAFRTGSNPSSRINMALRF